MAAKLDGSKYFYVSLKIHIFWSNINNSINFSLFVSSELNGFKYSRVSLTIQLNISHLFIRSWMIKEFYFKQFS